MSDLYEGMRQLIQAAKAVDRGEAPPRLDDPGLDFVARRMKLAADLADIRAAHMGTHVELNYVVMEPNK